jgi:hypothetical protein
MSEYRFERLSDSNLKDLLFLYHHAFNENESLNFLKKKYDTSVFGLKHVGFIAYSAANEPAAYYGVFPMKAQFSGREILVAQSGDTMTHPNHRGKGLFITLAKMSYELAKNSGVEFIFGFPNDNSYPGFVKKLGWTHYGNINNYRIKTGSVPLDKFAKKFKFLSGTYSSFFLNKFSKINSDKPFENSLGKQLPGFGHIPHDLHFYNYKTYYLSYIIEIKGVKCWIKVDGRLWVGDIEYCERSKFLEVVNVLGSLCKNISCSTLQFSVYENSSYDLWLKEKYPIHSKNAVGCLDLTNNYDPKSFAYQAVDFDTF